MHAKRFADVARCSHTKLKGSVALCIAVVIAGCAALPLAPTKPETRPPEPTAPAAPPTTSRGQFNIGAGMLDTWNAVGQIVVRTDGVIYEGRAQMLGLYSVRYRGQPFLILTRALPLSDTIRSLTTQVTAASTSGKPIDSNAAAELLAVLQRELPAEIERVRARQAREKK
jgi:hypothetical protein